MTDYTYIIFDVDGTLINFEKSERRAFSRTMEACGIFDNDELHRKYTDICDSVWEEYDLDNTKDAYIRKNYHQLYRSYAVRRFAELGKRTEFGENTGRIAGFTPGIIRKKGFRNRKRKRYAGVCHNIIRWFSLQMVWRRSRYPEPLYSETA